MYGSSYNTFLNWVVSHFPPACVWEKETHIRSQKAAHQFHGVSKTWVLFMWITVPTLIVVLASCAWHTLIMAPAHTTVQWHDILELVPEMRQVCWCSSVLLQYAWNSVQFAALDLPLSPLNVQMMLHTFLCHVCMPLSIKPLEWILFSPDFLHYRHVSITAFHKIKKILVCGNTRWTCSVLLFLWKMMDFKNESCLSKEKRRRK